MQVADRSIALKRRQKTSLIGAKEKPLAKLVDNYFLNILGIYLVGLINKSMIVYYNVEKLMLIVQDEVSG